MGSLSPWHLLILVAVLVLLFGAKKLPDAARSVGRSLKILKAETKGLREDETDEADQPEVKSLPPVQATATAATAGDDDKVAELQRQLDELKQQSPKNAG
jgi:sec-independent protein translocase protein TatA